MSVQSQKKRIIVHLSTGNSLRGGERQLIALHTGLLRRGISSIILCKEGSELSRLNSKELSAVSWFGEADVIGLFRLILGCRSNKATIIHCHDSHALSHGSIIGKMLGIPVIYTRRVVFPLHGNFFSQWKYRQCSRIIAISTAVTDQCCTIMPQEKINIIPDGVDWNRTILSRADARQALGVSEDAFVVGSVGYFTREKNLPLLVYLAKSLQSIKPEVRIVCIGSVEAGIKSFPGNMVCVGLKPDAVIFYNAFDAYASSSTHEGLGSALLDAVVRDIPAVAINAGGTRDIFPENWPLFASHDKEGFVNEVHAIIESPRQARKRAGQCGERARSIFSIDSMIDRTIELYEKIALKQ
jgi:glycosyltransferase involved in cell wall biosynthesis